MNRLDFLIVIGSLLTLHPAINTNLTFLRIFRMLRIARLYKRYPTLSELLATVLSSLVRPLFWVPMRWQAGMGWVDVRLFCFFFFLLLLLFF